jgi:hypothetical protein
MRQKLNLITLGVEDLQRSVNFYEKVLGWKRSPASQEEIVFFQLGGIALSLYSKKALAEDTTVNEQGNGFAGFTLSHNTKSEKEVDEVMAEVQKLGATIVKPAQKVFWGGYSGYFKDPDGYLIEVAYNPFWELDENDNVKL